MLRLTPPLLPLPHPPIPPPPCTLTHRPRRLQKRTKWRWLYTMTTAMRWAASLASALAALHAAEPPFVHGDVKVWAKGARRAAARAGSGTRGFSGAPRLQQQHTGRCLPPSPRDCRSFFHARKTDPRQAINVFLTDTMTVDAATVKLGDLKPHRWVGGGLGPGAGVCSGEVVA
jgi:hypothetical protein